MLKFLVLLLTVSLVELSFAQKDNYHPFIDQSFLIIASSKDYNSALLTAQEAQKSLSYELRLNEYSPDETKGFTSDVVCGCGEIHSYYPRGNHDDGNHISIEYSSAYDEFAEGYYIVIVSSGKEKAVRKMLPKVKESFSQAYVKNAEIYVGCMH